MPTQKTTAQTQPATVRDYLLAFTRASVGLSADMQAMNVKRAGTYTNMVLAGITAGDSKVFSEACEAFADEIRQNTRGIAKALGCTVAKRQPKDQPKSRPTFVVPSAYSAAKSYVLSAFEYGVLLGTAEEPVAYTAIRKAVDTAKAAAAVSELKGDDKVRHDIGAALDLLAERLEKLNGSALESVRKAVADIIARTNRKAGKPAKPVAESEESAPAESAGERIAA